MLASSSTTAAARTLTGCGEELGVGTEARSADHDDPYAEYDDEDALDDDAAMMSDDDDEDDWSRSR